MLNIEREDFFTFHPRPAESNAKAVIGEKTNNAGRFGDEMAAGLVGGGKR